MPNIRKTFNFRDGVQVDDEVLVVTGDRVGVGTTSPDKSLDVRGNVQVVGIITADNSIISGVGTFNTIKVGTGITLDATSGVISATTFKGDGSTLSNLPTSQWVDVNVGLGFTSIYNAGGNVDVKVRFNEAVDITGTPQLTLTNSRAGGGSAATLVLDYLSGTGKFEIIFRKAVGAGSTAYEEDDVLSVGTNVLSLNGGTIKDKGTNTASTITNVAGIGSAAGTLTIGT